MAGTSSRLPPSIIPITSIQERRKGPIGAEGREESDA